MNVYLNGLGILSACGRGVEALRSGLQTGWRSPGRVTVHNGEELPVYALPPGTLEDKSLGRKVRRADRLSKMAVFAAADALNDARLSPDLDRRRIGLIVTSALGSHGTTFQFLDEILTYGDTGVSPTVFSHSVQNAAAAYITSTLEIQGPGITLTQVHFAFQHGVALAAAWLKSGRCDHVLVGGMDELGSVLQAVWRSLRPTALDGKIRPFGFHRDPVGVPGEGSAFMLLSAEKTSGTYLILKNIQIGPWAPAECMPDLHILEADGTLENESGYALPARSGATLAAYAPLFGSMPGGSALQLAAAALMLKEQVCFASPVADAMGALPICRENIFGVLSSIHLTRLDCLGNSASIQLESVPKL